VRLHQHPVFLAERLRHDGQLLAALEVNHEVPTSTAVQVLLKLDDLGDDVAGPVLRAAVAVLDRADHLVEVARIHELVSDLVHLRGYRAEEGATMIAARRAAALRTGLPAPGKPPTPAVGGAVRDTDERISARTTAHPSGVPRQTPPISG